MGPLLALLLLCSRAGGQLDYQDYGSDYQDYDYYPEPKAPAHLALALVNSSFRVGCGGEGGPLLHGGQEVVLGGRVERTGARGYTVRGARAPDSGVWGCGGEDLAVVVLASSGTVHLLEGHGKVLANTSVVTVQEGSHLHPACGLVLAPGVAAPAWPPAWTWEGQVAEVDSEQVVQSDGDHLVSHLGVILVHRSQHGARLGCQVGGLAPVWVSLQVEHQPEFTLGREPGFGSPASLGSRLALLCTVEASPASSPVWEKDGKLVARGSKLEFPRLEADHEGWYVCSTSHAMGNFSSVGYYLSVKAGEGGHRSTTLSGQVRVVETRASAPLCERDPRAPMVEPPEPVRTTIGSRATIVMQLCSNTPASRVIWAGPGGLLLEPGQERLGVEALDLERGNTCDLAKLVVEQVEDVHQGEWIMVARNK